MNEVDKVKEIISKKWRNLMSLMAASRHYIRLCNARAQQNAAATGVGPSKKHLC